MDFLELSEAVQVMLTHFWPHEEVWKRNEETGRLERVIMVWPYGINPDLDDRTIGRPPTPPLPGLFDEDDEDDEEDEEDEEEAVEEAEGKAEGEAVEVDDLFDPSSDEEEN